jgi:hypothetical protein
MSLHALASHTFTLGLRLHKVADDAHFHLGNRPWQPTKKLTLPAMAGLRALHSADPLTFSREVLSRRFGISFEAVSRILRSRFAETTLESGSGSRDQTLTQKQHPQHGIRLGTAATTGPGARAGAGAGAGADEIAEPSLKGTKWDMTPESGKGISPVPAIQRALELRQTAMEMGHLARTRTEARSRARVGATTTATATVSANHTE